MATEDRRAGAGSGERRRPLPRRALLPLLALSLAAAAALASSVALLSRHRRGTTRTRTTTLHVPPSLDAEGQRRLANSLALDDGGCLWRPPTYDVPPDVEFFKTLVVGYPSGDKRMAWLQMEALAGWPAKDEWDFAYAGMTNHPFVKANWPHHEGYWGWADAADQVVLTVPYIRRSMVEYHDILADLGYPAEWSDPASRPEMYQDRPAIEAMYEWRDSRVLDECYWYGWFIDYWMEGGLLRDIFTHRLVTADHWQALMLRPFFPREQLSYDKWSDGGPVYPAYDQHCVDGDVSTGCEPVAVISVDKLVDYADGPAETAKIANALLSDARMGDNVIDREAWDCIWTELIENKKGPKTIRERPGYDPNEINFSVEMLNEMISQLNRLTTKYSHDPWNTKPTANRLVELLTEHISSLQAEVDEVLSGARTLRARDFLGPETRERRLVRTTNRTDEGLGGEAAARGSAASERRKAEEHRARFDEFGQDLFMKKRRGIQTAMDMGSHDARLLPDNANKPDKVKETSYEVPVQLTQNDEMEKGFGTGLTSASFFRRMWLVSTTTVIALIFAML